MNNIKVKMKPELHKKISTLMRNIDKLNSGKEIALWIKGQYKREEQTLILELEDYYMPKQEVTGTEVNIEENDIISMIKEIGQEETQKIKAHLHIHSFAEKETNWSGTDESKIETFMDDKTNRQIFCFILCSKTIMKARIEINIKTEIAGQEITLRKSIDNIEIETEEENKYMEELEKEIEKKITTKKYIVTTKGTYKTYYPANYVIVKTKQEEETNESDYYQYVVTTRKDLVIIKMSTTLAKKLEENDQLVSDELMQADNKINKGNITIWNYKLKDKDMANRVAKMLEAELIGLIQEFVVNDQVEKEEQKTIEESLYEGRANKKQYENYGRYNYDGWYT